MLATINSKVAQLITATPHTEKLFVIEKWENQLCEHIGKYLKAT